MDESLPLRRFLVAVDGTDLSDPAVHAAAVLASALGADLELVHAVDVPPTLWVRVSPAELARLHQGTLDTSRAHLVAHLEGLERAHALPPGSLEHKLEVLPGRPARVVLDRQRESGADVLFLGPHAERGLFDFGSTTRAVLHHAQGGIWLQKGPFRPIETILVPVDLAEESAYVIATARVIAERLRAEVVVLHSVVQPVLNPPLTQAETLGWPVPNMDELRAEARRGIDTLVGSLDWGSVRHRTVLAADPPQVAIHAMQDLAQLVVIGTRSRRGISSLILGSVAYAVLKNARGGVLAIRRPER